MNDVPKLDRYPDIANNGPAVIHAKTAAELMTETQDQPQLQPGEYEENGVIFRGVQRASEALLPTNSSAEK